MPGIRVRLLENKCLVLIKAVARQSTRQVQEYLQVHFAWLDLIHPLDNFLVKKCKQILRYTNKR